MFVRDAMAKEVWSCRADEPLSTAARLMWEHDVGAVPVVDAVGKLTGIITDRDVCMAAYFTGGPLAAEPVRAHMSTQVFTATPEDRVEAAEELMQSKQIRRLPVVDVAGQLVGMVSLSDLARAAATRGSKLLDSSEVIATLAAIVQPRARLVAAA
jgi:CBS domain-containing protein